MTCWFALYEDIGNLCKISMGSILSTNFSYQCRTSQ